MPVLAKGKTTTGRLWTYVRDDRPFAGPAPPAALFRYSPDRRGKHPNRHLAGCAGILRADAYAGFNDLYDPSRKPGPVTDAGRWAHAPLVEDLEIWMRAARFKLSRHAEVAKAIDYMLRRWNNFSRFLTDGRICLANNAAEPALRSIAIFCQLVLIEIT